jgi:hypothetical protein
MISNFDKTFMALFFLHFATCCPKLPKDVDDTTTTEKSTEESGVDHYTMCHVKSKFCDFI